MRNKKSSHRLWLVMALLAVISYFIFMGALKDGITMNNDGNKGVSNVSSIKELKKKIFFSLDVPSYVTEFEEELNMEVIAGQIVTINNSKLVLKAAMFVDINADILGLYGKSTVEKRYFVNDSDIVYFCYRQGYEDYPNCTIINWHTDETSYGLMIEDNISFEESLSILGIAERQLNTDYIENNNDSEFTVSDGKIIEYSIEDKYTIKLPEFNGEVTYIDTEGTTAFFAGGNLLFLVTYDNKDTYEEQSVIVVSDNIKIYYKSSNTYDNGTDAYLDYELMLSTIDDIAKTIVWK